MLTADNLNVYISESTNTYFHTNVSSLSVGSTLNQTTSNGTEYKILALPNGSSDGILSIYITVPTTGTSGSSSDDDNGLIIVGVIFILYFIVPWVFMFAVMMYLYLIKRKKLNSKKRLREERRNRRNDARPTVNVTVASPYQNYNNIQGETAHQYGENELDDGVQTAIANSLRPGQGNY